MAGTLFGIGVAAALIHLSVGEGSWARAATFGALVAPVAGAAVGGYTGQRDFGRHSRRYSRMAQLLSELHPEMLAASSLKTVQSVASQVDALIREDNGDWFGSVRLHEVELPS